jgi:hypothetical protein
MKARTQDKFKRRFRHGTRKKERKEVLTRKNSKKS